MAEDMIMKGFLREQFAEAKELLAHSDLVEIHATMGEPPTRYLLSYHCKCLVRMQDGEIREADHALVGITFPPDFLLRVDPLRIVTWIEPLNVHHPNINPPVLCVGHLVPGTPLTSVIHQVYDVITYQKWASHDALNPDAAAWARQHQDSFPIDRRPLRRRVLNLTVEAIQSTGAGRP